jgi:hypothetical protein
VPMEELPPGSREGIWLLVRLVDGNLVEAELDLEKTAEVKERIRKKRAHLLARMQRHGE